MTLLRVMGVWSFPCSEEIRDDINSHEFLMQKL